MGGSPGSMTAAMRAVAPARGHETWLRIGVVRGGAIVEERWLRPGRSLRWGRSERADVVIAGAAHDVADLVRAGEGGWEIVGGPGIGGRVSSGAEVRDLAGSGAHPIAEGARARIELGEVIVLLERRMRPPERARATVPLSGGAFGIDERFTAIALGSLCLHAAFLLVAGEIDAPYESALAAIERDAEIVFVEPEIPEVTRDDGPTVADADPTDAEQADSSPTDAPPSDAPSSDAPTRPAHAGRPRSSPSASEIALAQEDAIAQVDLLIGSIGTEGALADLMRDAPGTDAERVFADVATAGEARASRGLEMRDHGDALADLGACDGCGLAVRETRAVDEGRARGERDVRPPPLPILEEPELGPGGELPPDVLAREIARRRRRVQACYERALTSEPELAGRLVVAMRVEETGTLSRVRVEAGSIGSDAFQSCVVRAFDGFRTTAPPEGGAVDVSFPFVLVPQR